MRRVLLGRIAPEIGDELDSLSGEFNLQVSSPLANWLRNTYFSTDGTLELVAVSPPHLSRIA